MTDLAIANKIEQALIHGDLSKLSGEERISYYNRTCESLKLNPLTKPFEYITLNGKLTLYAKRDATDQLRKIHNVSVKIVSRERVGDVFTVTAQASMPDGRVDESIGAVQVGTLKGDALANALMKAESKAKRRVTLSICGLGLLDESEVATIHPQPAIREVPKLVETRPDVSGGDYIIPIGKKYKGMALKDVPVEEIEGFVSWLNNSADEKGEPLSGAAREFVEKASAYLVGLGL